MKWIKKTQKETDTSIFDEEGIFLPEVQLVEKYQETESSALALNLDVVIEIKGWDKAMKTEETDK
ncbi:MAG: hypothetical protein AAFY71_14670 [Bacteroidota bacterium]